ncbi:hypothetical protein WJX84_010790 [Apatococcus fuscideae]|uniref:Vacuolar protein sorting-associated protein 13 VPS13 adaptor binding domain-containing protein n=2 Tax=Apatococcus fuscideae TaxID=2026836 RepID=A0AAW1STI1_9CHLO
MDLTVFAKGAAEAIQDIAECSTALLATWRHADQGRGLTQPAPAIFAIYRPASEALLTINISDCCLELVDNMPAGLGSAMALHPSATIVVALEPSATVVRALDLSQLTCSVSGEGRCSITGKLEDLSIWASFHRLCPVVAAGLTAHRLHSQLRRIAIKLGWLPEYPAQEDTILTRIGASFDFEIAIQQMATSKAGRTPQNSGIQIDPGRAAALPVITEAATAWHGMFGICGPLLLETLITTHFEVALAVASSGHTRSVSMVLQTAPKRGGGCNITLHSGLQVRNDTTLMVSIRTAATSGMLTSQEVQAGQAFWLPLTLTPATDVAVLPTEHEGPVLEWSQEARLSAAAGNGDRPSVLVCPQASNPAAGLSFCAGIQKLPMPEGVCLVIGAPLVVQNTLPMPVQVLLRPDGYRNAGPTRLAIYPRRQVALYHLKLDDVDSMMVQPSGFQWCSSIKLPFGAASEREACPQSVSADVVEAVEGGRAVPIQITRQQNPVTGAYALTVSCALWVYNCTGLPIALQQLQQQEDAEMEISYKAGHMVEDDVPKRWVAPYEGTAEDPTQTQSSSGSVSDSQPSSRPSYAGLGKLLGSAVSTSQPDFRLRAGSKHRSSPLSQGMAEGMDSVPSYATPTRWPSMQGGPFFHKRHVQLQVRTSQRQAPSGRTYWSNGVQLDAVGAAAVVLVPCPSAAYGQIGPPCDGAYIMSISAKQVVGGNGALAVQLMPRYMLQNILDMPIQYKQQGTMFEHELGMGKSRAIYWSDAAKPLLLCMRVQEAGWLWSGGVSLEGPGDQFVKIRHRDRQYTKLIRVDVSVTPEGVLLAALSHEAEGFAPYRLDNCTGETLHVSQEECTDQKLGAFSLNQVGLQTFVQLPGSQRMADPVQKVQRHWPKLAPSASGLAAADNSEWLPWSGALTATAPDLNTPATPQGMNLEVLFDIPAMGISAAFPTHEVLYAHCDWHSDPRSS